MDRLDNAAIPDPACCVAAPELPESLRTRERSYCLQGTPDGGTTKGTVSSDPDPRRQWNRYAAYADRLARRIKNEIVEAAALVDVLGLADCMEAVEHEGLTSTRADRSRSRRSAGALRSKAPLLPSSNGLAARDTLPIAHTQAAGLQMRIERIAATADVLHDVVAGGHFDGGIRWISGGVFSTMPSRVAEITRRRPR